MILAVTCHTPHAYAREVHLNSTVAVVESQTFNPQDVWEKFADTLRIKYAYAERPEIKLDKQLDRSGRLAMQVRTEAELRALLRATVFALLDPHLVINPYTKGDYGYAHGDLILAFKSGRATIIDVRHGSPAFLEGLRPGDVVREIDAEEPQIAALRPFKEVMLAPTSEHLDFGLTLAANGRAGHRRQLVVTDGDGADRMIGLPPVGEYADASSGRPPVELRFTGSDRQIAHIVLHNSLGDNATIKEFDRAMVEAASAKAIVLDLRETPSGGNTEVARSIIGHFVLEPQPYQMHRVPVLQREFTVPRQFVEYALPRAPFFPGTLVVLHGRWTASMGEGLVIGLDAATDAVTIGSDMADHLGAIWVEELGMATSLRFGGESMFHVDGQPREEYVADIEVDPASVGFGSGDRALDCAIEVVDALQSTHSPVGMTCDIARMGWAK